MGIPQELEDKLNAMGFTGDFTQLGISVGEALSLEPGTLMRRINEALGVHAEFAAQVEARNLEGNQNFSSMMSSDGFTRIVQ